MRAVLVVAALLVSVPARADTPEGKLRYAIGTICENTQDVSLIKEYLRPDALVTVRGVPFDPAGDIVLLETMNIHRPSKIAIAFDADKHTAWWQTTCEGKSAVPGQKGSAPHADKLRVHVSGLAFEQADHDWKMGALAFSVTMPDSELVERLSLVAEPSAPDLVGDAELGKAIAGWFTAGKLATSAAASAMAAGSAPDEIGSGAAATKLATTWDKMKLLPAKIDAKVSGRFGTAYALLAWNYKGKYLLLMLTVIAVHDAAGWKWAVLDFEA